MLDWIYALQILISSGSSFARTTYLYIIQFSLVLRLPSATDPVRETTGLSDFLFLIINCSPDNRLRNKKEDKTHPQAAKVQSNLAPFSPLLLAGHHWTRTISCGEYPDTDTILKALVGDTRVPWNESTNEARKRQSIIRAVPSVIH